LAQAQDLNNYFNLTYSPDVGDATSNTSETIPHASVFASGDGSYDFYKFTVTSAPSKVILDVDHHADRGVQVDTVMFVYNENGEVVAQGDDSQTYEGQSGSSQALDPFLSFTLNTVGTYYVRITEFTNDGSVGGISQGAAYTLQVSVEHPLFDTDGDGMPNYWETIFNLNINSSADAGIDSDTDGLTNLQEFALGTDPRESDTDGDGLIDGHEVNTYNTEPLLSDSDRDGLNDGLELNTYNTDVHNRDSDNDGLTDGDEVHIYGTNPLSMDSDADGMSDYFEVTYNFNPAANNGEASQDTDMDGLSNLAEYLAGTNPTSTDTDLDGVPDGVDALPLDGSESLDFDGDGIGNNADQDDDNDGVSDLVELASGTDPFDKTDFPGATLSWMNILLKKQDTAPAKAAKQTAPQHSDVPKEFN
jgi:hypothetical protein